MKTARHSGDPTNRRKVEHISIIKEDAATDRQKHYFDEIRLRHRALPEINLDEVDTSIVFLGKRLSLPLIISCMTGGDHTVLRKINRNLAVAAERRGVAMGVGSQRVMFLQPGARASFELRRYAPTALLFANLGAVQLNKGFTIQQCREAMEVLEADGLYLHLNPLQEAVQPEGDTQFRGLAEKIGEVAEALPKPVIVKEVGAGISREDAHLLVAEGIRFIDVAGAGGTSWSRIEHHRVRDAGHAHGLLFQDWGLPTPRALWDLRDLRPEVTLIASGGLRSGLDMAKAMVLGASLCGLAAPFLQPALKSAEAVEEEIERLRREFRIALFLLGVRSPAELIGHLEYIFEAPPSWGIP
ncbi:MAG: type 2 isopentenyl-diphosphate Delta-isomerase [Kiritimatiellae bacterium]|nr:type 2 isopentenyl-diphosphate Delta-isomerase [Kiritimatiellia bacterium]MDW8459175.1 type 2 isopentenyl-diphosphate Delta-isomerase [Verrucomicrobiota bacterium]